MARSMPGAKGLEPLPLRQPEAAPPRQLSDFLPSAFELTPQKPLLSALLLLPP